MINHSIPTYVRKDISTYIEELVKEGKCSITREQNILLITAIPPTTKEELQTLILKMYF